MELTFWRDMIICFPGKSFQDI